MDHLIQRVRASPILWDVKHSHYRDIGRKRATWDKVAKECDLLDGQEARQLWVKLRNSHREARRRRIEDNTLKPWKYEEEMEFLITGNTSNIDTYNTQHTSAISREENESMDNDHNETYEFETCTSNFDSKEDIKSETEVKTTTLKRRRVMDDRANSEDKATEWERNEHEHIPIHRTTIEERSRDGLNELFASLCEKTRNLPKHLQLRVQREIFESVTKAEEEALRLSNYTVI